MTTPLCNTRLAAARVIEKIQEGASLADCLEPMLLPFTDARDRAFVQAISYGVCRYYPRLDFLLANLLKKPMQEKDSDVQSLLLVGLYQLSEMRVPTHAAVSETVNAAGSLKKKPWARGLVNAILRGYLRQQAILNEQIKKDEEANFCHPIWWITAIKENWPSHWQEILRANNEHPPFALRINLQHFTRDKYLAQVNEAKIIPETKAGIILTTPIAADKLPHFAEGSVTVQDGAAQLAVELLAPEVNHRVLDACSAPGGKLTHIIELQPQLAAIVAVDKDKWRCQSINENLLRAGAVDKVTIIQKDAANVKSWFDGKLFDRILLDAPCSASGVIRRHPDIKLLRNPDDIAVLAKEQRHLLAALWPLLAPGGLLLYATCSIFPQENVDVVQAFLASTTDAKEEQITADWGMACAIGRQILPGMHHMDGFYYAKLKKMV